MSIKDFIRSRSFWLNVMLMAIVLLLLAILTLYWLKIFTRHGESITVPDLTDLTITQVDQQLKSKNLRFQIMDSTFVVGKPAGTVIGQYPLPENKVKENRSIFLTINSSIAPTVKMPNLIDKSYRYAQLQLKNMGLVMGEITRKPDLAKDAVLEQLFKNKSIEPGKLITKGSTVDLVVGDGYGATKFQIPNLQNKSYSEAKFNIEGASLKMGILIVDPSVKDTMSSIVYKQSPDYTIGRNVQIGQSIDLFIRDAELHEEILEAEREEAEQKLLDSVSNLNKEFPVKKKSF